MVKVSYPKRPALDGLQGSIVKLLQRSCEQQRTQCFVVAPSLPVVYVVLNFRHSVAQYRTY